MLVLAALSASGTQARAATYTVSSNGDSNAPTSGSLRRAILDANANAAADTINFTLAASTTINLTSPLPDLTGNGDVINGASAPGGAGSVTISGSGITTATPLLLTVTGTNCQVRGLRWVGAASGTAIRVGGNGNAVAQNTIGLDANEAIVTPQMSIGIEVNGSSNTIGGAGDRNVISGLTNSGIWVRTLAPLGAPDDNVISGNFIGTDSTGVAARANGVGVQVSGGSTNTIIGGAATGASNVISGSTNQGVLITGVGTSGSQLISNIIGLDVAGGAAVGNGDTGVKIEAGASNTVLRINIISGNAAGGVFIQGVGTTGTQVQGNFIGTDSNGGAAVLNNGAGIFIVDAPNCVIGGAGGGDGNVLSGNFGAGLSISGNSATGTQVLGNTIGLDSSGSVAVPNIGDGVRVQSAAANSLTQIGGATAAARNVISGNGGNGIFLITGGGGGTLRGVTVQGNFIGTDSSGTADVGNTASGIRIEEASLNTIGGDGVGEGNVISGNGGTGIVFVGGFTVASASANNTIFQNLIGTDSSGTAALGNDLSGITIFDAPNNVVGGVGLRQGNTIAFNGGSGVLVGTPFAPFASGNVVRGNSLFENSGLGIDLVAAGDPANGVTPNDTPPLPDSYDSDTGANGLQNKPVVGRAQSTVRGTEVFVYLFSTPSQTFDIDIYSTPAGGADPSGEGEGRTLVTSVPLTTSAFVPATPGTPGSPGVPATPGTPASPGGFGGFIITVPDADLPVGSIASAVATRRSAPLDSSEFSNAFEVLPPDRSIVTTTNDTGVGSLRDAIDFLNAQGSGTITFDIPVGGVQTISPASPLPPITAPITIDGTSQPGASVNTLAAGTNANLLIELSGAASGLPSGLSLNGGGATVRGLAISGFAATGGAFQGSIVLSSDNNTVEGCFLGTDAAGGGPRNNYSGLFVNSGDGNTIGGPDLEDRNLISNSLHIGLDAFDSNGNTIQNNLIGTNAAGTAALANLDGGVLLNSSSRNTVGGTDATQRNVIAGNGAEGVRIDTNSPTDTATANQVLGNFIGLSASGAAAVPNGDGVGLNSNARGNTIGGTAPGARNVLSGNSGSGVAVRASGNQVLGNFIGTNTGGTGAISNAFGVIVAGVNGLDIGNGTVAGRNVVSGNGVNAIQIGQSSTNVRVRGNFVGLSAAGTGTVPNGFAGIIIQSGASGNTVGGTVAGQGNVVSGNGYAVQLDGSAVGGGATSSNVVQGNIIGLDAAGTAVLGNRNSGVFVQDNSTGNLIGGTAAGARNVIAGNASYGVQIDGAGATGNQVLGNAIGTNASGSAALGNGADGVALLGGASGNSIGGVASGAGNVIASNRGAGVRVAGASTRGNGVRANSMYGNGGLGIDLAGGTEDASGVTANDPGDADSGPNDLTNAPVLARVVILNGAATAFGTLDALPSQSYELDLYSDTSASIAANGYGQGRSFLQTQTVTTNTSGRAEFAITSAASGTVSGTLLYSVTASPSGSSTSELSRAVAAIPAALTLTVAPALVSEGAGAGASRGTVTRNADTSAALTVALASSDATAARVPASVTIPAGAASATFAIEAVDDSVADGSQVATLTASAAGLASATAQITVADDDAPSIAVAPTSGLFTSEDGATSTFTVALGTAPRADVTITFTSSDVGEGTVSPSTLTFTRANFATPQTVTARGVDDSIVDGDQPYTISGAATSPGADYNGRAVPTVRLTNRDNDRLSLALSPASLSLTEGGSTTVVLRRSLALPTPLTVALAAAPASSGLSAPATVTIAAGATDSARFTITASDDRRVNGARTATLTASASGYASGVARVRISDDDAAAIVVTPSSGLVTGEDGRASAFRVSLSSQPTASVTIALSSSDASEATVAPSSVTFTPQNFATPQTVTVRGVDDSLVDGDQRFTINTAPAASSDANYRGLNASNVSGVNRDNDVPRLSLVLPASTLGEGQSAQATLTRSAPATAPLSVALSSSDASALAVPASVRFGAGQLSLTFTVRSPDDFLLNPGRSSVLTASAAGFPPERVRVGIVDNDLARIVVVAASRLATSESGGASTFTVRLGAQPSSPVSIALSSTNPREGRVSPSALVFSAANFARSVTVTVRGVDDEIVDGAVRYGVAFGPSRSQDARFNGLRAAPVALSNADNDVAALLLSITPRAFSEGAGARAAVATVQRNFGLGGALQVLVASSSARVAVPRLVTIPAGAFSATFPLAAVATVQDEGTQNVAITARSGRLAVAQAVTVSDGPALRLNLSPSTVAEGAGSATATLTRNFGLAQALTVALSSSESSLRLPASATFAAGDATVSFAVAAPADSLTQGPRDATITAQGGGQATRATLRVTDSTAPAVGAPLQAWGYNQYAQIGDGTTSNRPLVVDALTLDGATQVAAGGSHSLALGRGGVVFAWGYNISGQLGDGTTTTRPRAVAVQSADGSGQLSGVTQLAAGWYHSLALLPDGTVLAWGRNADGELGDGTRTARLRPVRVRGLSNVRSVVASVNFSAAITNDGALWAWGRNTRGQLGDGTTTSRDVPQRVRGEDGTPLTNVASASLGAEFALALRSDGVALAWGANQDGQLAQDTGREVGQDSALARPIRTVALGGSAKVAAPSWRAVAAGYVHCALLTRDGRVFSCGNNYFLQLGRPAEDADGTLRPVVEALGSANPLGGITALSAGAGHTVALSGEGTLRAWGWNQYGTLGDGTTQNRAAPIVVRGLGAVRSFSAGYGHTLALGN